MTDKEKLKRILADPVLWIESFCKIVDKKGQLVPFKLNPQQKILLKQSDKYNIILKARQIGVSVCSVAYSIYLAITQPNSTCLLMSYSIDSATGIFEKLKQIYYDLPTVIQVHLIANNKKELKFVNGSRIIVCTCGNKDAARGLSIAFAHLSEVAFMKDTINKQLLAIEQALLPNAKIFLESTANGLNFFHELYQKSERGENLYKPFFFSWIDSGKMFEDEYKQFAQRYIDLHGRLPNIDELSETEKDLYSRNTTIQQIVWRRLKIANSSEAEFKQEFPSSPLEAFITTGSDVFEAQLIHERLSHIHNIKPISSQPTGLPVSLKPWLNRGLLIWESPKLETRYYIGVDTGEGLGKDFSTIEVIDQDGAQVAEFRNNKTKAFQFAEIVNDIGIFYNKALLVVEKASAGHTVCDKLRNEYRYLNMYKYKEYDARGNAKKRVGYVTNAKTKPIMINDFVELFSTNQLLIRSKDLLSEMKTFSFKDGKMGAISGFNDDLVMGMALAIQGLKSKMHYI